MFISVCDRDKRAIVSIARDIVRLGFKVVATGGLSRLVADNTELIDVVDPQLVLDGLRIIYERARR